MPHHQLHLQRMRVRERAQILKSPVAFVLREDLRALVYFEHNHLHQSL